MLSTLLILFILIIASVGFSLQARRDVITKRRSRIENYNDVAEQKVRIERLGNEESQEIMRTIGLIGHKAYQDMKQRISKIMKRHRNQRSITVDLTCGPDTFDGAHELHRLLPGQPVKLVSCRTNGVDTIDAYYNGVRIGRLALIEEAAVNEIMQSNKIVGAYVAEQNCYGCLNSHQMNLIIFFEEREHHNRFSEHLRSSMNSNASSKNATSQICMN